MEINFELLKLMIFLDECYRSKPKILAWISSDYFESLLIPQ